MIIEDHSHEVKDIEPAARSPETALFLTPPSYDPRLPPPIYDPTVPLLLSQRFGKRRHDIPFVCWFIASLIVFAVFVEIVFIPALKQMPKFLYGSPSSQYTSPPSPNQPTSTQQSNEPLPTSPPHGSSCVSSQSWSHHGSVSSTSVQLPLDAEVLRFDKLGSHAEGTISFTSSSVSSGEFVNVEVMAHHLARDIADQAGICVQRGARHGVHGITLLTNISDAYPASPVKYDVRVSFPGPPTHTPGRPRQYSRLETDLIDFRHELQLPLEHVRFQSVKLRSGMARISAQALAAEDIDIKTTQYPIDGHFDVGSALTLETDLSRIEASVKLHAKSGGVTSLNMKTTEGPTWAKVSCLPAQMHLGDFVIKSVTSNASSSMIVDSLPFGAALNLDSRSTAEQVLVQVPLTYEGSFDIMSSGALDINEPQTLIETLDPDAWDPQELGRRRNIDLNLIGPRVQGIVLWTTLLGRTQRRINNMITMRTTKNALTVLRL